MTTRRLSRPLAGIALLGLAAVVALWLLEIFGGLANHALARTAAIGTLVAIGVWLLVAAVELVRTPKSVERTRTFVLLLLLAVAFVVRFTALDFEVMEPPVNDEGVFHEVSQRINVDKPLPEAFNYGHFLYYAGAFMLWLHELFAGALTRFLELFYTTVEAYGAQRLMLKSINAALAALTSGAVFGAACRIAGQRSGLLAGIVGSLLITFSPLYNEIAHQLIADVPAAAFASFSLYFISRLLDQERVSDYALAGVMAGLAAGSKYPGGVVAVGIFAIWLYWRTKKRSWSWDLLWATLASIGAMLAVMPGLLLIPEKAFRGEGLDIFMGLRQYAYGGWIGVQPDSNLAWYGRELLENFAWPALFLGLLGVLLLTSEQRRRWLLMAVFPIGYLTLMVSMSMVVHRNLQAALPGVAMLLGVGASALAGRLGRSGRLWSAAVAIAVLALPVWKTGTWDLSRLRPGTRQLARQWVHDNVPEGATLIRERYSPRLSTERYGLSTHRFAAWQNPVEMISGQWDYLILARPAYGRFVGVEGLQNSDQREYQRRYEVMFDFPMVAEFVPKPLVAGPLLHIFRLDPEEFDWRRERLFYPDEATYISHEDLRRDGPGKYLQYTKKWQYAVFKDFFAAGSYQLELGMNPAPEEGYLHVVDRKNREVGTYNLLEDFVVELPRNEKYLFRVFIAPPTRLYGLRVESISTVSPSAAD